MKKTLLLAMAASVHASPLALGSSASEGPAPEKTTIAVPAENIPKRWTPPDIPEGAIDISNNTALINELKREHGLEVYDEETSSNPAKEGDVVVMSGPCDQGTCPDYDKGFDMLYTWTMITSPGSGGAPPTTLVWNDFDIRVNDCGQCYRKRVGSTGGGCYDFTACGRQQSICVDSGKDRAHRIWKDVNVKKCYRMGEIGMGDCGPIQARVIWRPDQEVACNW